MNGGSPAGWHPAPDAPGQQRYYDGTQWTDHYAPAAPQAQYGGPPPGPPPKKGGAAKIIIPIAAVLVLVLVVIAVVAVVLVSGGDDDDTASSGGGREPTTTDQPTTTDDDPATTGASPTTDAPSTTAGSGENPQFGDTYEWDGGITVSISEPSDFTPSDTAAGGEGASDHVTFEVTVVNGSSENYEPSSLSISVQSGSGEGDQVFDTAQGIDGSPNTAILPDRDVVFDVAFGVTDPDDLVVEVAPGFDYEPAFFTS